MIVTLTANPALDRTITLLAPLQRGEVQAAGSVREDAGGKGVNVARAIAAAGQPALAVLPLAEHDPYAVPLQASGVAARRVPVHGAVRANLTIVDPAGETTKLNLSGSPMTDQDARALVAAVVDACAGARWLVLAGSLPPGAADDFYVRVVESVRAAHGGAAPRVAVDTSGPALRAVIDAGLADLVKPNDEELAELAGAALPEPAGDAPDEAAHAAADAAVLAVARELVPGRARAALVTLGSRGALLITAEGAWAARAPRIRLASTVGAGDSSLAGYLLAESAGADEPERLRTAIRYGAAAASLPGTQPPAPHDLPADALEVHRLE